MDPIVLNKAAVWRIGFERWYENEAHNLETPSVESASISTWLASMSSSRQANADKIRMRKDSWQGDAAYNIGP